MDQIDRKILRALQRDGRMSNRALSDVVGLSPSPCLRRLKALEETGIIRGYHADVDPKLYGLPITVFIRIRLERHDEETVRQFETRVKEIDKIVECHVMTGQADYLLRVMAADLTDYEQFVRRELQPIGGIASIDTSFAYGQVKQRAAFPFV
jgi:Lrp/AsnC family leucine-responsive transcriptional regulator